ncbi:MAG: hypothetical protein MHM6MM_001941 [Cercozoa sp. M6MM]
MLERPVVFWRPVCGELEVAERVSYSGEVSANAWPCAFALCEFLLQELRHRTSSELTLIEIGAGVALPSFVVAHHIVNAADAKGNDPVQRLRCVLTDASESHLLPAKLTIERFFARSRNVLFERRCLDWNDADCFDWSAVLPQSSESQEDQTSNSTDLWMLLSDVFYESRHFDAVCSTVRLFLQQVLQRRDFRTRVFCAFQDRGTTRPIEMTLRQHGLRKRAVAFDIRTLLIDPGAALLPATREALARTPGDFADVEIFEIVSSGTNNAHE